MITKPTVFVLGAGISAPFGFPVGRQMKDAICNGGYGTNPFRHQTLSPEKMATLITAAGESHLSSSLNNAKLFLDAFRESDMYSIDAWLEANQADKGLLAAGKVAIAAVIMNAERIAMEGGADVGQDWFAWLWNNIWTPNIENLAENKVAFVTFNYDRLFEWKLHRQIKSTYMRATEPQRKAAYDALKSKIVHAHGEIRPPKSTDDFYGFGESSFHDLYNGPGAAAVFEAKRKIYADCMREYSKSINIVCENPSGDELIDKAKKLIEYAHTNSVGRLVFLGFSFDKRNVAKLELGDFAQRRAGNHFLDKKKLESYLDSFPIVGTGMGIKRGESADIETMFRDKIVLGPDKMDAVEFCRNYVRCSSD